MGAPLSACASLAGASDRVPHVDRTKDILMGFFFRSQNINMSLSFPPIPITFLSMFGPAEHCNVIWENPCTGVFGIVVRTNPSVAIDNDRVQAVVAGATVGALPEQSEYVFETPSELIIPSIPEHCRAADPPLCLHGQPSVRRMVQRKDSVNIGRIFYTCSRPAPLRCGFFRWADDLVNYSEVRLGEPMSAEQVLKETAQVTSELQLRAWKGLKQGSQDWHQMRRCRITASNFGSVHNNNQYSSPMDLLRSLLWPCSFDSTAMQYTSRPVLRTVCDRWFN